jgi:hypothetical protein
VRRGGAEGPVEEAEGKLPLVQGRPGGRLRGAAARARRSRRFWRRGGGAGAGGAAVATAVLLLVARAAEGGDVAERADEADAIAAAAAAAAAVGWVEANHHAAAGAEGLRQLTPGPDREKSQLSLEKYPEVGFIFYYLYNGNISDY